MLLAHLCAKDQEVELLSRVALFESLSKEEIRELLRQNSEVCLREGETFYAPWEQGGKLFVLKKGRMRLYRTEGGSEFTLEVVDGGTVFGEMAFTPHRLRESYARAMQSCLIFAMERTEVERLIEEKPQVGIRIISLLSERLHYYETRMEACQPVEIRLCSDEGRPPSGQMRPATTHRIRRAQGRHLCQLPRTTPPSRYQPLYVLAGGD
jgi:CRP-like cAMP-binding protein